MTTEQGGELRFGRIDADAVVIAMGPWSLIAAGWVHLPRVFGQRSPSLVYDTGTDVPADALFLEYYDVRGVAVTVKVFPRADGSTLVTAFSDQDPITRGGDAAFQREIPGCAGQPHTTIEGGGHFLQEDKGEELARVVIAWLRA